jgi:predicted transport protein
MAKDSQRLEQEFIASTKEKTGHSLDEWMGIAAGAGLDKPNALIKWLKDNYKLNHMQAQFITGIFLNGGKPVYDYTVMFANLFAGKATVKPLYDALAQQIQAELPADVELAPTKTYISIEGKRVFACATLTKTGLRVGLDLGAHPFDEYTQKAKSLGAMPNLTHMVEVTSADGINTRLIDALKQAYHNAHS